MQCVSREGKGTPPPVRELGSRGTVVEHFGLQLKLIGAFCGRTDSQVTLLKTVPPAGNKHRFT